MLEHITWELSVWHSSLQTSQVEAVAGQQKGREFMVQEMELQLQDQTTSTAVQLKNLLYQWLACDDSERGTGQPAALYAA